MSSIYQRNAENECGVLLFKEIRLMEDANYLRIKFRIYYWTVESGKD